MNQENPDTYPTPAHGWTCFHCGETYLHHYSARQHFGATPDKVPACLMKIEPGDRPLLRKIRALEAEADRLRTDLEFDTTGTKVFCGRLQSMLNAYKPFRGCRTIQDVFNVYDSMEGRAIAAEEWARRYRTQPLLSHITAKVSRFPIWQQWLRARVAVTFWLCWYGDGLRDAWQESARIWSFATVMDPRHVVRTHLKARYAPSDGKIPETGEDEQ
jgi:hypothetical protein